MTEDLRISMIQSHIIWEDREENLGYYGELLRRVSGRTDLAVLPETFTTGFSMDVEKQADTMDGRTVPTIKEWAKKYKLAVAGSFIAKDNGKFYNRAFFITPEGEEYYYDKRHLFRMAEEDKHFSAGDKRLIVPYKGWNICLQVCYDLRFPVWSRNVNNEYDLLIYVANWPEARKKAWKALLHARAIENMAYVCGVNRVGRYIVASSSPCSAISVGTVSGGRRPKPHSVATPKSVTTCRAAATRRFAPSRPSVRCTSPR